MMQQAVDDCISYQWITKDLVPLGKVDVRGDNGAVSFIPFVYQLKKSFPYVLTDMPKIPKELRVGRDERFMPWSLKIPEYCFIKK